MPGNTQEEFDAAFDKAVAGEELKNHEPAQTPAPEPAPTPVDAPAEDGGQATTVAAPATEPAAIDWEQKFKSLEGIARNQGQELKSYRAKLAELDQQIAQAKALPAPQPAKAEPDPEDELIAELDESAPTVAKSVRALVAKERKQMQAEFDAKFKSTGDSFRQEIEPLKRSSEQADIAAHEAAISAKHPGWEQTALSLDFQNWVSNKPAYQQRELQRIAATGTADEINEVFDEFKATKQATKPASTMQDHRARAATAVDSKVRPTSTGSMAAKTFDDAWDEALRKSES
jgi:hypothetical protein